MHSIIHMTHFTEPTQIEFTAYMLLITFNNNKPLIVLLQGIFQTGGNT